MREGRHGVSSLCYVCCVQQHDLCLCGGGDGGRRSVWKHTTVQLCTLSRRLVLGT